MFENFILDTPLDETFNIFFFLKLSFFLHFLFMLLLFLLLFFSLFTFSFLYYLINGLIGLYFGLQFFGRNKWQIILEMIKLLNLTRICIFWILNMNDIIQGEWLIRHQISKEFRLFIELLDGFIRINKSWCLDADDVCKLCKYLVANWILKFNWIMSILWVSPFHLYQLARFKWSPCNRIPLIFFYERHNVE